MPIQKASRQILASAAVLIGGAEGLASRLDISGPVLKRYLEGDEEIPSAVLLHAIDFILEDLRAAVAAIRQDSSRPKS
jgi:hypothetical protein